MEVITSQDVPRVWARLKAALGTGVSPRAHASGNSLPKTSQLLEHFTSRVLCFKEKGGSNDVSKLGGILY